MKLKEKLLLKLGQDPNYQGADETEKALIAEIKAEMAAEAKAKGTGEGGDEVKQAAKEMATQMMELVKTLVTQAADAQKAAQPVRPAGGDVNDKGAADLEAEIAEKTKGMSETEANKFRKAYRFAEFAKAIYRKDTSRTKALAEGVDADGGYLVPDEFRAELIQHLLAGESFRKYATVIPMTSKYLEIPKLTSDVKVYWGTENQRITTTTADFGNMTFTPFRLNAIIYTSRELFDDSAIAIFEVLRSRFTMRVRDEENKVFLTGNGTTQPKGISQETLRAVNASNALTPDHITAAYWKLPEGYRPTSRWLVNSRTMEHLETRKDSQNRYLYESLQGEVKTLKGRPIFVSDYVPSTKIWLGDPSAYFVADRQEVTMDMTTEAGNTWEKYQVGLRIIERLDGELSLTQPFVQISNTGVN